MKHKLLAIIGILAILSGLLLGSAFGAANASAQAVGSVAVLEPTLHAAALNDGPTVETGSKIYLPLVVAAGQPGPQPDSPYAAALSQALADCEDTALNQVCYASGSVTLAGGGPLTTPGQVAPLTGVSGLTLASPDAGHWSVALLRLSADSSTPGLGLTLLAFGNVEIRDLTLYDAAAGNGDVTPALLFRSTPVPGQDPETGGLVVYNPNHEEPLFINLNGADLTLASSAVVQAQPGAKMTVTMATGSALVSTAAGDSAVVQTQQLTVPLNGNGAAAGAPTAPTIPGEELLEPLVPVAPIIPATPKPSLETVIDSILADFDSAQNRCMQGNSRQVYRVMYYARLLVLAGDLPDDRMSLIDFEVTNCATFEIEFNSVINGTSTITRGSTYVQGQGMIVKYGMDGGLRVQQPTMPLTHLSYDFDIVTPMCPYEYVLSDGALSLYDSSMRINRNRLDISTKVYPVQIDEHFIYNCPGLPPVLLPSYAFWREMFRSLHSSEQVDNGLAYLFTPAHWKYTGNQILAEAIFTDREAMFWDGVAGGETWLVMLHKPGD